MKLEKCRKHDDEGNAYEYVVKQKLAGKYKRRSVLFWISCVLLVVIWFVFGAITKFWPLLCLIPLSIWVFYYFVHPYVAVEYKYEIESNTISAYVMYGERLEGLYFSLPIKDFECICPNTPEYSGKITEASPAVTYRCVSDTAEPDTYFAIFDNAEGVKSVFYFEATDFALKKLKYYNAETVLTPVKR